MNYVTMIGFLAAGLVIATLSMRTMIPLRIIGLASNIAFVTYGVLFGSIPTVILHSILFPLNVYRLQHSSGLRLFLIDLPGYGYAGRRDGGTEFDAMVTGYFAARREAAAPTLALLAVDGRHPGLPVDLASWEWLGGAGVDRQVVVTKVDKLKAAARATHLREFGQLFDAPVAAVSAERGEGIDTLWTLIRKRLQPS